MDVVDCGCFLSDAMLLSVHIAWLFHTVVNHIITRAFFINLYFDFCWELAPETWTKGTVDYSMQVHDPDHTHSFVHLQQSGLLTSEPWSRLKLPSVPAKNGAPTRFIQRRGEKSTQCQPRLFYSQPQHPIPKGDLTLVMSYTSTHDPDCQVNC